MDLKILNHHTQIIFAWPAVRIKENNEFSLCLQGAGILQPIIIKARPDKTLDPRRGRVNPVRRHKDDLTSWKGQTPGLLYDFAEIGLNMWFT